MHKKVPPKQSSHIPSPSNSQYHIYLNSSELTTPHLNLPFQLQLGHRQAIMPSILLLLLSTISKSEWLNQISYYKIVDQITFWKKNKIFFYPITNTNMLCRPNRKNRAFRIIQITRLSIVCQPPQTKIIANANCKNLSKLH